MGRGDICLFDCSVTAERSRLLGFHSQSSFESKSLSLFAALLHKCHDVLNEHDVFSGIWFALYQS